jgi:hypothetical protein
MAFKSIDKFHDRSAFAERHHRKQNKVLSIRLACRAEANLLAKAGGANRTNIEPFV